VPFSNCLLEERLICFLNHLVASTAISFGIAKGAKFRLQACKQMSECRKRMPQLVAFFKTYFTKGFREAFRLARNASICYPSRQQNTASKRFCAPPVKPPRLPPSEKVLLSDSQLFCKSDQSQKARVTAEVVSVLKNGKWSGGGLNFRI
jgi:hypothetical protein